MAPTTQEETESHYAQLDKLYRRKQVRAAVDFIFSRLSLNEGVEAAKLAVALADRCCSDESGLQDGELEIHFLAVAAEVVVRGRCV